MNEAAILCAAYYPAKLPVFTVLDLPMLTPTDIMAQARVQMALAEHPAMQQEPTTPPLRHKQAARVPLPLRCFPRTI